MVLEYVPNGELFDYILKKGHLEEDEGRKFFRQLVAGVSYIHNHNICHRDIKPENLLLDKDMNIKISDFGLSAFVGDDAYGRRVDALSCRPELAAAHDLRFSQLRGSRGAEGLRLRRASERHLERGRGAVPFYPSISPRFVMMAGFLPFDEPSLSTLFRRIQTANYTCPPYPPPRGYPQMVLRLPPRPPRPHPRPRSRGTCLPPRRTSPRGSRLDLPTPLVPRRRSPARCAIAPAAAIPAAASRPRRLLHGTGIPAGK